MIPLNISLSHYKRIDVREEIIANSKDREVAAKFNDNFGKRPDILRNSNDVLELAKLGATSFHASEELWRNPLQLDTSLQKHDLDKLRAGWDLVLDIDCGIFEYSREAAHLVVHALKFHNVRSISCKFSGNKGFHIGVPFNAFPEKTGNEETRCLFPDAPRRIAFYIKEMIKNELSSRILKIDDFSTILRKTGKTEKDVIFYENKAKKLNPEPFLNIDTLLISSRHLYRMPYSLHEKSGLVSTPLNPEKVLQFTKEFAIPKNVRISRHRFLDNEGVEANEARQLLTEALDFTIKQESGLSRDAKEFTAPAKALPEELFPPCIKFILNGLDDGKKRALFILLNYFTSVGWDYEITEKKLMEWNLKNKEPLRDVYLLGQLRYHKQTKKKILPPNCPKRVNYMPLVNQQNNYTEIGICRPDNFCGKIKNPAQYTTKKSWLIERGGKGKAPKNAAKQV